ncbi:DNA/RNA non-specific endonuclease [Leptospira fluminis]|uniref:DNA/RNA non-specific endonuclease n=1 Tax=Leptospira fluminis TaxID=2484979 RepID=A0A4R9GMB3_9LEPT|nr:DNA/RNA non-specific endonuclease [Leptospira fluminis]TGK14790.1 DNA/RNA non-specific endonuclease [Leptospira fluminis]
MTIAGIEEKVIQREGYTLQHSSLYKSALWVCEEIRSEELTGPTKRKNRFLPDPELEKGKRAENSDYTNSGYDRGHLAAADNYKSSQRLNDETFYLSNIAPQIHSFNAGIWKRLEDGSRNWARKYGSVYVITGSLFQDERTIGENEVRVPTHFFKIVILKKGEDEIEGGVFTFPHQKAAPGTKLKGALYPLSWVEERSNLRFFPARGNSDTEILPLPDLYEE